MTSHKPLPPNLDLRVFRNQVQSLVNKQASQNDATPMSVADARHAVAREYGFGRLGRPPYRDRTRLHVHGAGGGA